MRDNEVLSIFIRIYLWLLNIIKKISHYRHLEAIMASFLFLVLFILSYDFILSFRHHAFRFDNAFLIEIIKNVAANNEPLTSLISSISFASSYWTAEAASICTTNFDVDLVPVNQLVNHAYYSVYIYGFFAKFFNAADLAYFSHVMAFMLMPLIVYYNLRTLKVSIPAALFFSGIVFFHFAVSFGIMGQIYFDKFAMPGLLAFLFLGYRLLNAPHASRSASAIPLLVLLAIFTALHTERMALMIGLSIFLLLFLSKAERKWMPLHLFFFITAACAFIWVAVYVLLFRDISGPVGNASLNISLRGALNYFSKNPLHFVEYVLINVGILGLFSVFGGLRFVISLVGLLGLNTLIQIGGANLTGWSTHYHAHYFPVLVFLSAIGYVKLYNKTYRKPYKKYVIQLVPIVIIVSLWSGLFEFNKLPYKNTNHTFQNSAAHYIKSKFIGAPLVDNRVLTARFERMAQATKAETFSSVESGFFFLSDYTGYYFPVRNSNADFILLNSHNAKDYSGVVSYRSADQAKIAQNCIEENMEKQGYDLYSPILLKYPLVAIPSGQITKKWSETVVHEDQNVVIPAGDIMGLNPCAMTPCLPVY